MTLKPKLLTLALSAGLMSVGGLLVAPAEAAAAKSPPQAQQAAKTVYTCPMDPEVVSEKPGRCPKCKMHLEKTTLKVDKAVAPAYVCPMHPKVASDKPGRCPECKMHLEKVKK